ncbi:hypothetical protein Peur_040023 [Populus x canadensis]|jgi:hypothetical protein
MKASGAAVFLLLEQGGVVLVVCGQVDSPLRKVEIMWKIVHGIKCFKNQNGRDNCAIREKAMILSMACEIVTNDPIF